MRPHSTFWLQHRHRTSASRTSPVFVLMTTFAFPPCSMTDTSSIDCPVVCLSWSGAPPEAWSLFVFFEANFRMPLGLPTWIVLADSRFLKSLTMYCACSHFEQLLQRTIMCSGLYGVSHLQISHSFDRAPVCLLCCCLQKYWSGSGGVDSSSASFQYCI